MAAWRRTLVIMVKAPAAGAVKTRLAREIGAVEALRFYRSTMTSLIRRLGRDPRWRTVLAVSPDAALLSPVWPGGLMRRPQGRGDLGQRMQRLFDRLPPGPVAIVGSDIPGIRPAHVAAAFRALGRVDAAFGPAEDGGYWLIGLKRLPSVPRVFAGVRWSSRHALGDTLANLRGLRIAMLETLPDVDDAEDWRRWRRASGPRRAAA